MRLVLVYQNDVRIVDDLVVALDVAPHVAMFFFAHGIIKLKEYMKLYVACKLVHGRYYDLMPKSGLSFEFQISALTPDSQP